MTTFDTILILSGGASLAAVVGYVSWLELRVAKLKTELLEAYAKFRVECKSLNAISDPAYQEMCGIFDAFIDSAEMVSLPLFAYLASVRKKDKTPYTQLATTNAGLEKAIDCAMDSLARSIAYHITHRTLAGGIVYTVLRVWPKSLVKSRARRAVRESVGPLQGFYHNGHLGHA